VADVEERAKVLVLAQPTRGAFEDNFNIVHGYLGDY
jgi:hypothetical protein